MIKNLFITFIFTIFLSGCCSYFAERSEINIENAISIKKMEKEKEWLKQKKTGLHSYPPIFCPSSNMIWVVDTNDFYEICLSDENNKRIYSFKQKYYEKGQYNFNFIPRYLKSGKYIICFENNSDTWKKEMLLLM